MTAQTMREIRKAQGINLGEAARTRGITVHQLCQIEMADARHHEERSKGKILDGQGRVLWDSQAIAAGHDAVAKQVLGFKVYPADENGETLCAGRMEIAKGGIDKVAENMLKAANPELLGLTYAKGKVTIPLKPLMVSVHDFEDTQRQIARERRIKRKRGQIKKLENRWNNIKDFWEKKLAQENKELGDMQQGL